MANLHLVNKANSNMIIAADDHIVLLQDGVYTQPQHKNIYAIKQDVLDRGLQNSIAPQIQLINYDELVELTTQADKIISW